MMNTRKLILKVLGTQSLTVGQLKGQVTSAATALSSPSAHRLTGGLHTLAPSARGIEQSLRYLVSSGHVIAERVNDGLPGALLRYSLPKPRYYIEPDTSGRGVQLVRRGDCEIVIGKGMTEAEALTCVTGLNELDRKVREIRGGL